MGLSVSGSRKSLGAYAGVFIGSLGWMVKLDSSKSWVAASSLEGGGVHGRPSEAVGDSL
jgi:hypothetical protein